MAMEVLRTSRESEAWLRIVEPPRGEDEVEGRYPIQEHLNHTVPNEYLVSGDCMSKRDLLRAGDCRSVQLVSLAPSKP